MSICITGNKVVKGGLYRSIRGDWFCHCGGRLTGYGNPYGDYSGPGVTGVIQKYKSYRCRKCGEKYPAKLLER